MMHVTTGDSSTNILHNLAVVKEAEDIGLILSTLKCKIITQDHTIRCTILMSVPGSILGEVTNPAVVSDDRAWSQVTLPVKLEGLGVCSAVDVAPSAYLLHCKQLMPFLRSFAYKYVLLHTIFDG